MPWSPPFMTLDDIIITFQAREKATYMTPIINYVIVSLCTIVEFLLLREVVKKKHLRKLAMCRCAVWHQYCKCHQANKNPFRIHSLRTTVIMNISPTMDWLMFVNFGFLFINFTWGKYQYSQFVRYEVGAKTQILFYYNMWDWFPNMKFKVCKLHLPFTSFAN